MKISCAIKRLEEIRKEHGDLIITGGYMTDDEPLKSIVLIDKKGCDVVDSLRDPEGVFLE